MSGPPYPASIPDSNAIGSFTIGVSPIGTIKPFDFWKTVISQYANSKILVQLISNFDQYLDMTQNFDLFFDNIFNIATASGKGLDIWGAIVGVTRTLTISTTTFFGFEQQAPAVDVFGPGGQSPFFSGTSSTLNYSLTDSAFRILIYAKALANISDGSIPFLNQLLLNLFPNRGNAYVVDGLDMTMEYVFNFALTPVEVAIVTQSGVLPKSTGVSVTFVQNF